ncbi:MAG: hypothetical protein AAGC60_17670 [Acidobacteriota bacterium]
MSSTTANAGGEVKAGPSPPKPPVDDIIDLERPATRCVAVQALPTSGLFRDDFESGDLSAWGTAVRRISVRHTVDLQLAVELAADFAGDSVLHLDLTTPRGHHYQTLTAAMTTAQPPTGAAATDGVALRRVDGFPRPLQVSRAERSGLGSRVLLRLPVAGTPIVSSGLYGEWRVTPRLDDESAACGPSGRFLIVP